jgi:streptogramin lyase
MYEKGQGVAKNEAEAAHWRGMLAEEERHENMLIQSTKRSVEFGIVAPIEASHWPVKAGTFSLLAGNIDGPGSADGIGLNAQFSDGSCEGMGAIQKGIASDKDGNIYLADEGNDTIRKLSPSGTVSTVAGKAGYAGSTDGIGSEARFNCPTSVAIDGEGNLFVTDSANFTIRKITPSGQVSTIAGQAGEHGLVDGKGAAARFHRTKGIAIGADGTLYVADTFNASIRKISPDGVVTTLAGGLKGGYADGKGTAASFNNPTDVALDDLDNVYVVDQMNDAIRKISPAGVVTTFLASDASSITVAGNTFATTLNGMLSGVGVDKSGNVYVSTLREIYKVSADGKLSTLAGSKYRGTSDGQGVSASFSNPGHVAVSPSGDVVVADEYSIRSIKSEGIVTTLAGRARQGGSKDGAGVDAQFDQPQGIVADRQGNVYVSDTGNAVIRKITPLGLVTTYAGTLKRHALKDAKGTAAEMNYVNQLAIDGNANLYFTDAINHVVRKIDAHGDVTTFAGTAGLSGNVDGMGSQARFKRPVAITADPKGNLYVYDFDSDAIRKIDSHGTVTTVKGISLKDMGQDDASVQLSADGLGNIYVTVSKSIYSVIRKVDRHGVVTTLVGVTDTYGIPSDLNGMPRKTLPRAHVSDAVGNVYFFDSLYSTIRKAAPDGSITTIAGTPGTYGITLGSPGSVNGVSGMAILDSKTLVLTSGNAILKLSIP